MRFILSVLAVVLAGCATPKTAPDSFYGDVYTLGGFPVGEGDKYRSTAGVFARDDIAVARKAAYARLLLGAQEEGYHYFVVGDE